MNLYEALGIGETASLSEIKAAYRSAVKAHHPDVGGDPARFMRVRQAYLVLSDPRRRALYDQTGLEEDAASTDDHDAYGALIAAFLQAVDGDGDLRRTDIVGAVRVHLETQEAALQANRRSTENQIARVRLMGERLHSDHLAQDPVFAALAERQASLEDALGRGRAALGTMHRALELLGSYSYERDALSPEEAAIWSALRGGSARS